MCIVKLRVAMVACTVSARSSLGRAVGSLIKKQNDFTTAQSRQVVGVTNWLYRGMEGHTLPSDAKAKL